jgi:hypothetical protein
MRARASGSFTLAGWSSSNPRTVAASATGGGDSWRPLPFRRSGRVTTSAGRWGLAARRREAKR